jgi:hypothetical protein
MPLRLKKVNSSIFLLVGRLFHDLYSIDKALPPQTKLLFELDRSSDSFYIGVRDTTDTEQYRAIITNCCLYVPIGVLTLPLYTEIANRCGFKTF